MRKLDRGIAARIFEELDEIAKLEDPRVRGKSLTGNLAGVWRYRVGDYRILCEIERQGCRPLKTGNSKLPVFQSASALPSRPLKPFGSKMEVRKKSTTVEFVRTLPKSCNSKSGLGR